MPFETAGDSRAKAMIAEMPAATTDDVRAASLEADTIARHANANTEAEIKSLSLRVRYLRVRNFSRAPVKTDDDLAVVG